MASSSKKIHVRSISFPSRSHPSTLRVEEELNKLRASESSSSSPSTSDSVFKGLTGLEDLYISVDELLNLPSTQQVFSQHRHEKMVEDLLDESLRILDVCHVARDMVFQIKEQVKGLQSALRRRKGDSSIEISICNFISLRKKMKKDVKKMITNLKKVDNKSSVVLDSDDHLSSVIHALREVNFMNVSIFQSLLGFLEAPSKQKSSKWGLVSKLIQKEGKISCETKSNEIECVEQELTSLCKYGADAERMKSAREQLEALDLSIEGLDNGLEGVFRRLIKTRASLLNIISL